MERSHALDSDENLSDAIISGDAEQLRDLLKKGADPNQKDTFGMPVLHLAVLSGSRDCAAMLLDHGADVNARQATGSGFSALHHAALAGDTEMIQLLLSKNADMGVKDGTGFTPVFTAAFNGQKAAVSQLLAKGANPDQNVPAIHWAVLMDKEDEVRALLSNDKSTVRSVDIIKATPLHYVAISGNKKVADLLVQNGADINARDNDGASPLLWAVLRKKDLVPFFIQKGADPKCTTNEGSTVFHHAAIDGDLNTAQLLLGKGVDINAQNSSGRTALHIAAQYAGKEFVLFLLENGARTDVRDEAGKTPMRVAQERSRKEITKILKSLDTAIDAGNVESASTLPAHKADINAGDNHDFTPLHSATYKNEIEIAEELIKKGAHVNAQDKDGWTPLHYAALFNHGPLAKLLIAHGGDVQITSNNGKTPIMLARSKNNEKMIKLLMDESGLTDVSSIALLDAVKANNVLGVKKSISEGTSVRAKDYDGKTSLHLASAKGFAGIVEMLLGEGAEIDAKDNNGLTPLHLAVMNKHADVLDLLIKGRANLNVKDGTGFTALHWAAFTGDVRTAEYLIRAGASMEAVNENRETPLFVAAQNGQTRTAALLVAHGANIFAVNNKDVSPKRVAELMKRASTHELLEIAEKHGTGLFSKLYRLLTVNQDELDERAPEPRKRPVMHGTENSQTAFDELIYFQPLVIQNIEAVDNAITLEYTFRKGESLRYDMALTAEIGTIIGKEVLTAKIRHYVGLKCDILDDQNGEYQTKTYADRVMVQAKGDEGAIIFSLDTSNPKEVERAKKDKRLRGFLYLMECPAYVTVNRFGEVLDYDLKALKQRMRKTETPEIGAMIEHLYDQMIEGIFVSLPEGPVENGSAWEAGELTHYAPALGRFSTLVTCSLIGKTEVSGDIYYVVKGGGDVSFKRDAESEVNASLVDSDQSSLMLFSTSRGIPNYAETKGSFTLEFTKGDEKGRTTIYSDLKLRSHKTAQWQ